MAYAAFTERSIGMEEGTKTSNRYRSLLIFDLGSDRIYTVGNRLFLEWRYRRSGDQV